MKLLKQPLKHGRMGARIVKNAYNGFRALRSRYLPSRGSTALSPAPAR
jgi:hypothetical protein